MLSLRTRIHQLKGLLNAALDKAYQVTRRARQKILSKRDIPPNDASIHILCTARKEYVKATIRCLNSFWEFNPEFSAKIWLDEPFWQNRFELFSTLDRFDRTLFSLIPDKTREWQWNKLLILVDHMNPNDMFSDADMIWNGRLPEIQNVTFFIREYDLVSRAATRRIVSKLVSTTDCTFFMYNVSFVKLSNLARNLKLSKNSKNYYNSIRNCLPDEVLGEGDIPLLKRMSEQIALSIAIQRDFSEAIDVLKDSDYVMDGGLAESYYLGSSAGWE